MSRVELGHALKELSARRGRLEFYENYYRGRHRLAFATTKFREAFGMLFAAFSDNLCKPVVNATLDRLEVTGWAVANAPEGVSTEEAKKAARALWDLSKLDLMSGRVHKEALIKGDAYVMVWPDEGGMPRFYFQRPECVYLEYSDEDPGRILWAAKTWEADDDRQRVNVYFPDRVEKWVTPKPVSRHQVKATAFVPFEEEEGGPEIPNPYARVPIFHFAPEGGDGEEGTPELCDATSIQDALNKSVCDLLVAMEFASFPQRYAIGLEVEVDPATGKPVGAPPFQAGPGRIWSMGNTEGSFGSFPTADVEKLAGVADGFRLEMARVTGTPLSYMALTGTSNVSGDALKALDARMVKKAKRRQREFGAVWADAMNFAFSVAAKAGGASANGLQVVPVWEPAEYVNPKERADVAAIEKDLGIPLEVVFEHYGAEEADAKAWAVAAAANQASALENLARGFNGGGSEL